VDKAIHGLCPLGRVGKSQGFSNSLPPLPAAVGDAVPNGFTWTKPAVFTWTKPSMAFVHLGELEKAKVFQTRCRRFLRRLVTQCQTVLRGQSLLSLRGQSHPWPLSTWASWKKPRFFNSLPPHPAAVGDAVPNSFTWTKPSVAFVHLSELEKAKVFQTRCRRFLRRLVTQCQTVGSTSAFQL
jgi:hypothetical protein